jgi:16S rRNA (cytosine967-C5)-methyltransferase
LLLRLSQDDLDRLASLQVELLARAVALVRPGGTLTYAVCSLSRVEGVGVAEAIERRFAVLQRIDAGAHLPDITSDSDGVLRIGPWLGNGLSEPDGYQVVSWEVSA